MLMRCIDWRVRTVGTGIFLTNSLKVFEVNSTAVRVFLMCDGKHDLDMMVSVIKTTFQVDCSDEEIRSDIKEALDILKDIGALKG